LISTSPLTDRLFKENGDKNFHSIVFELKSYRIKYRYLPRMTKNWELIA